MLSLFGPFFTTHSHKRAHTLCQEVAPIDEKRGEEIDFLKNEIYSYSTVKSLLSCSREILLLHLIFYLNSRSYFKHGKNNYNTHTSYIHAISFRSLTCLSQACIDLYLYVCLNYKWFCIVYSICIIIIVKPNKVVRPNKLWLIKFSNYANMDKYQQLLAFVFQKTDFWKALYWTNVEYDLNE